MLRFLHPNGTGRPVGTSTTKYIDKLRRAAAGRTHPRIIDEQPSRGMLSICFDDFPKTAWTEGGRVLRDHAVRGTYFVCGGVAGTTFEGERMYDAEDLEAIHAEGHELGCHTFDHRSCLRRSGADLARAMAANQRFVRQRVGDVRLVSFAYPYGDTTIRAKRLAVARFACARGVLPGVNCGRLDLGQLKAVGLEVCRMRALGAERYVERYVSEAAARRAWLVVYTHDVQDSPSKFGCRPRDLELLVRAAKAAGLDITTVSRALAERVFVRAPVTTRLSMSPT